jgi:hypothetical protein
MSITRHRTRIRASRANITIIQTLTRHITIDPRLAMGRRAGFMSNRSTITNNLRTMGWRRTTPRRIITKC